ncbi:hypothetical protein [Aeromonas veronii]|uniref:hypothetical protein n=1 Tax=Aeromonas veronii TaxID=654 RepID=UPI003007600D
MKNTFNDFFNKLLNTYTLLRFNYSSNCLKKQLGYLYLNQHEKYDFNLVKQDYLAKILSYVIKEVPFYKGIDKPHLNNFTIVNKSIYQARRESDFQSQLFHFIAKYKMNTGGSTGEPFYFYAGLKAGLIDSLHQEYQHKKMGLTTDSKLYTFNGCMPERQLIEKNIFWQYKRHKSQLPFGSKEFSTHFLHEKNIEYYLKELLISPPDFIRSYPSAMCDLTQLLIKAGFNEKPFSLKGIQLTSEVMSTQQEDTIKAYWGDIIYHQYGHSEVATIASKYPGDDCYCFSPLYGEVEILDEDGKHVEPHCEGRIVVTSYHNYARPFIRYDTGDLAIYKDSNNGIVKAYNITGRAQDYVVNISNQNISVTGLVFGQHFKAFANILQWQIINSKPGDLLVRIVKSKDFVQEDENEVLDKLGFNGQFSVTIEYVKMIQKTVRGKHKLVIREFDS